MDPMRKGHVADRNMCPMPAAVLPDSTSRHRVPNNPIGPAPEERGLAGYRPDGKGGSVQR